MTFKAILFGLVALILGLGAPLTTAQERLPDGAVAKASGQGPLQAWYASPTTRYDHGILGDAIEAGSLVVVDDAGSRYQIDLPKTHVFEDLTPRLADLDGDGQNEIITIRTSLKAGAAVAIYAVAGGQLVEAAATQPIGLTHRWLSIAGIADFNGDGRFEIAVVKTPHIGGRLEVLSYQNGRLTSLFPEATGYSTHFIGSRFVSLAAVADLTGDGVPELVVPDQTRMRLIILSLKTGVKEIFAQDLPARIVQPIEVDQRGNISARIETGETFTLKRP